MQKPSDQASKGRIKATFKPPLMLRPAHIQTTLASLKPRKILARRRAGAMLDAAVPQILECGLGVRLLGAYSSSQANNKGLVILIHGWEGSIDSAYILSAAAYLFNRGFDIFRLNLRDHGDSHHLNREPFTSTRLTEAVEAVTQILQTYPHERNFLTGFSLGGNFVLRIGMRFSFGSPFLQKIVAVCPLIDPVAATFNLQANHPIYHRYFVNKWKRSLNRKLDFFPNLGYGQAMQEQKDLKTMHEYFVPHHTPYPTALDYLAAYRIHQEQLSELTVPTHIIAADDDPITRRADMKKIQPTPFITIESTTHGGHCGFLQGYSLKSWIDERLAQLCAYSADRPPQ